MEKIDEILTKADQELQGFLNTLLDHIPGPEATPLKTSQQLKEEYRHTLTDLFDGKELRERVKQAVEVIRKGISSHETPAVIDRIAEEWALGIKSFMSVLKKECSPEEGSLPPTLLEIFKISDDTFERFYQCGLREYQHGHYKEAADVFYLLSCMDYRRPNVWMALGLAEQKLHRNESAWIAFDMVCLTDPDNPVAFLKCAECHLSLGEKGEAKARLEKASNLVRNRTDSRSKSIQDQIASLKHKIQ